LEEILEESATLWLDKAIKKAFEKDFNHWIIDFESDFYFERGIIENAH